MARMLLSGNEAVAQAALDNGVSLGVGYPGTPSTEILEQFSAIGGSAQWSPNEKVAMEVGVGAAFAKAKVLVTMKHVGVNVAADPLFTAAYTGVSGSLVIACADDPGMASSQNEQDSRNYAKASGVPMLEPSDSQQAYDFMGLALQLSNQWQIPIFLRVTTRICHSKGIVNTAEQKLSHADCSYDRNIPERVMVPAYARPAHRRLREKLATVTNWNETAEINEVIENGKDLGIITSGISYVHASEAAPDASILKLSMTYPLPLDKIRNFADSVKRCIVIDEGDPYLVDSIRAAGIEVEGKAEMYRFGELNVARVKRILSGDVSPEAAPPKGKPPQLCQGCPHRHVFEVLSDKKCIVSGDIGCYTLGVLPPFEAMDTCVCMGASIGVALGMRRVLPEEQARRVVSVIGDSTFVHSGLTGIAEMVYNRPETGHVLLILDNSTTAMTGLQEHPGTGRLLNHEPAYQLDFAATVKAMGVDNVHVVDAGKEDDGFEQLLTDSLASSDITVIIAKRPCILAAKKIREYEQTQ